MLKNLSALKNSFVKKNERRMSEKEKKRISGKEASTFSNYIFSNVIVLPELGQSTMSKTDLILQGLIFFTCVLKSLPPAHRCFKS